MELSPEQQERYARHLLLDGFDQERVFAAAVRVRGTGVGALWAARVLAASGVGKLHVEVAEWHAELRGLGPWLEIVDPQTIALECVPAAESAEAGALAAAELIRKVSGP